ncbi:hypothetical protein C9994_05640 [Marivirga lumbricoides]|uniref:PpiC domain-containing protein n=1 Tax=Marivirga lumbricoides TaxID=1046115 RepID=A0A2T4DSM4_9BACT|nr:hypothetical protein C9994_05640 [Marivirga lumbricoides]
MRYIMLFLVFPILLVSCKSSQSGKKAVKSEVKPPLFSINETKVYPDEFMYAYEKSNKNKGETEAIEDYLKLYVNFKLKVEAAKKAGLDTLPSYQRELKGYLEDIKKPYLATEQITENLIEETFKRLQEEINASHILIKVSEDAQPEDTLKAYLKIKDIKQKHAEGKEFSELAFQYSEDPSAKANNGELGWFTAFQMVYPFESAAYNTPEGEVSDIVRTKFGYHIVKVNERRETLGRIKLAHIMLRYPQNANQQDSSAVEEKIFTVYDSLKNGGEWFSLASQYSEDLNTKNQGGSLPWFGAGNLPASLEKAAFDLSQPNEISEPVQSPYGWHILKLEEKRGVGSLESMRESLERRIQRDQRSELKISQILDTLKKENKFRRNEVIYKQLNTTNLMSDSALTAINKEEVLFSIADEDYKVRQWLAESSKKGKVKDALQEFEKNKLLAYEDEHLPEKYPEYRMLANEYRDGLLLFEIMSRKVWDKVSSDTIGLKQFYNENKEAYKREAAVVADIFIFNDTSQIDRFKNPIQNNFYSLSEPILYTNKASITKALDSLKKYSDTIFVQVERPVMMKKADSLQLYTTLKTTINQMELLNPINSGENKIYLHFLGRATEELLKVYDGLKAVKSGEFSEEEKLYGMKIPSKTGLSQSFNNNGDLQLIFVKEKVSARLKSFEESKPELITDYQNYLENKWIEQLKQENQVTINQELLDQLKSEVE